MQFRQDRISGGGPTKRLAVRVVVLHEMIVPTVALVSFSRWAIELFASPSALLRMMRARALAH
jgi:hypothetical protein